MMGMLAALVGFASSFAIVLQGLYAAGASQQQAASGLMVLSLSIGAGAIILSLATRMPVSMAWSTPGAAFLASTTVTGGFDTAVGAFIVSAILLTLAGLWKPLAQLVARIPKSLANAMLAGILFGLCLAPVRGIAEFPLTGLAIVLAWVVAGRFYRLAAVPAALVVFLIAITLQFSGNDDTVVATEVPSLWSSPVWVMPQFSLDALIGISIPLFVVTMASQNIPGMAVLNVNEYRPDSRPLYSLAGVFSLLIAPFGGHAVNLAAITAALCAGPDVHRDHNRRYWSAIVAGICYIVLGLFASRVIQMVSSAPTILLQSVAGLALIGTCTSSMLSAFESTEEREPAAVTFFVTVSGVTFFGVSGAFWGLVAGWFFLWFSSLINKKH